MKQEDRISFMDATKKGIHYYEKGGHCNVFHCNTIPNKYRPIKSIWSFKGKYKPDGELLNHKALLCAHGRMQQSGDSYWETYYPVVNMLNVHLILAIAKIYSLDSKSIDLVLDFPQAHLDYNI